MSRTENELDEAILHILNTSTMPLHLLALSECPTMVAETKVAIYDALRRLMTAGTVRRFETNAIVYYERITNNKKRAPY